ncbi:hypothetical protein ACNOYE_20230 [Nannocystaceae bacterium ST9]
MTNVRPGAKTAGVFSIGLMAAALLPIALTRCSYDYECDRTTAAIVLPEPGDAITLIGLACVDAGPDATVGVYVEGQDGSSAPVRLVVIDPVDGVDAGSSDYPEVDLQAATAHCDEGLEITIESEAEPGQSITAVVWLTASAEDSDRCDVELEAP